MLSIRPEFAEKIFAGTKTVELRRSRPRVKDGDWVLVYVSSPVKILMGMFQVDGVHEGVPECLWDELNDRAGVTREQFEAYYAGAERGVGIAVRSPTRLKHPLSLNQLRGAISDFHPPQGFRYLTQHELHRFDLRSAFV